MKTENLWDGRGNQMLFDYARVTAGQSVLIHGAAGNVGAYAVQMASRRAFTWSRALVLPIWTTFEI